MGPCFVGHLPSNAISTTTILDAMTDTASHEARIANLEKLVRELQAQLEIVQKQVGITAKPAEKPLRSRGMLGSPKGR
ncbi:hypothetical protein CO731_05072 [Aminobacter sp. MSH1]|nr:hypothetical protein CO731_05072 [Aminobacter sp. MSH1]